jgi:phosphatidylglycerophosphate synthase
MFALLMVEIGHARRISARNGWEGQVGHIEVPFPASAAAFMRRAMESEPPLLFVPVGTNAARAFGMDALDRACRLAANAGLECAGEVQPGRAVLLASMDYAWDPAWLKAMRKRPRAVLTLAGKPVMAHVPADVDATPVIAALESGSSVEGYEPLEAESASISYDELRKRERPFVMPLEAANPEPVERAAYDAAYKGVTDVLTLYLWRKAAFYLTRWAARARLRPNFVTLVGAVLCVLAFILFWRAQYWWGVVAGFIFMVLDTVDGKLARVTGASSKWGEVFDHGIDLIHPPFWYWAWEHGLAAYGRPLEPITVTMVLWAIISGYVAQRIIEGLFIKRFNGMHIHVWKRIDSQFRLITARRNPNMIILVASLLFGRPDVGLELVAWWTIVSLIFHAVRLAQATEQAVRGQPIVSWLDA